jgi:hypothetical protein
MLNLGAQLYQLTERDRATLGIEPFFRSLSLTAVGAATSGYGTITWPRDRALYIKKATAFFANPPGAFNWTEFAVGAGSTDTSTQHVLYVRGHPSSAVAMPGDDMTSPPAAGVGVVVSTPNLDLILPPGINLMSFTGYRNGGVANGDFTVYVTGYLIPPGQIGRSLV